MQRASPITNSMCGGIKMSLLSRTRQLPRQRAWTSIGCCGSRTSPDCGWCFARTLRVRPDQVLGKQAGGRNTLQNQPHDAWPRVLPEAAVTSHGGGCLAVATTFE